MAKDKPVSITRNTATGDCRVGTIDGRESEYAQSAIAGIDAGRADCKTRTGAGDVVFSHLNLRVQVCPKSILFSLN